MAKKSKAPPKKPTFKEQLKSRSKKIIPFLLPSVLFLILIILSYLAFDLVFANKFYPRTFIGDNHLFYQKRQEALANINAAYNDRLDQTVNFSFEGKTYQINLATSSASIDTQSAINQAFIKGHEKNFNERFLSQIDILLKGIEVTPKINLELDDQITTINKEVYKPAQNATIKMGLPAEGTGPAVINIASSKNGLEADKEKIISYLNDFLLTGKKDFTLPLKQVEPQVSTAEVIKAKRFLESTQKEPVVLTFEDLTFTIDPPTLFDLLNFSSPDNLLDKEKLGAYLTDIAEKINQPVIEPLFSFDETTKKVSAYKPAQEGRELDIQKTTQLISDALDGKANKKIILPIKTVQPKLKATAAESYGIKELLGEGLSNFAGSIPNRIFNVSHAAGKINGTLIAPGQEFSWNETVGDISAATGFKQAYVIKNGRTVLDDGGGVCQVSTTLYRAVLKSGLPIIERTAHAYRVGYYEQGFPPGLDATIFHPSVDLKFKNDTGNYILIQAEVQGTSLTVDLYGTSDGRVAYLTTPVINSQTPPPPETRQDDPNLPKGEVKQVEYAAYGAKVSFSRTVKRGEEVLIQETIFSNYRPWGAVYLVGTKEG